MLEKYNLGFDAIEQLNDKTIYTDNILLESFMEYNEGVEWAKLLCNIGNAEEFIEILSTSKSELLAIMKYRRLLMEQKKVTVSFIELNTAYTNNQFDKLHKLLEKMFLEPITARQFEFILNKIDSIRDGIEELYNRHIEDKGLRALSVALTL